MCAAQTQHGREELSNLSDLSSRGCGVDLAVHPREEITVMWPRTRAIENPLVIVVVVET